MTKAARVMEALWKIWKYPDLHKEMIKVEPDGAQLIKVGDITRIANELIDEMNETDEEPEESADDARKPKWKKERNKITPRSIGHILREEFQLQMTERRRDGFWVYLQRAAAAGAIDPVWGQPQPILDRRKGRKGVTDMRKNRCKNRSCEHVNIVNVTPRCCICFVELGRNAKQMALPHSDVHNVHMFTGPFWAFLRHFGAFFRHFA